MVPGGKWTAHSTTLITTRFLIQATITEDIMITSAMFSNFLLLFLLSFGGIFLMGSGTGVLLAAAYLSVRQHHIPSIYASGIAALIIGWICYLIGADGFAHSA